MMQSQTRLLNWIAAGVFLIVSNTAHDTTAGGIEAISTSVLALCFGVGAMFARTKP